MGTRREFPRRHLSLLWLTSNLTRGTSFVRARRGGRVLSVFYQYDFGLFIELNSGVILWILRDKSSSNREIENEFAMLFYRIRRFRQRIEVLEQLGAIHGRNLPPGRVRACERMR